MIGGRDAIQSLKGEVPFALGQDATARVGEDLRVRIIRMSESEVVVQVSSTDRFVQHVRVGDHVLSLRQGAPVELTFEILRSHGTTRILVKTGADVLGELPSGLRIAPVRLRFAPETEIDVSAKPGQDLRFLLVRMAAEGALRPLDEVERMKLLVREQGNEMAVWERQWRALSEHHSISKYKALVRIRSPGQVVLDLPPWVAAAVEQVTGMGAFPDRGGLGSLLDSASIPVQQEIDASPVFPR
jgi:hypothetical protein